MNFLNIPFPAPGVTTKKRGFAPAVTGTTFSIAENEDATVLGTISATDANVGDTITYSITAGNGAGKFAINATTGSLSTTGGLDYETTPQYVLTIRATDDGGLYGSGTVTVSATDVNEAPVVNDGQYFSISESAVSGTTLSPIAASDVDGDTLTYSITGGNTGTAFSINASTGVLSTEFQLDHETVASYSLTILVSDGALWDTTTVAITVSDVNEPPIAVDATFTEDENGGVSILGTIAASDVDDGATLTYSITAGNGDSLFTINASTGELSTTGDLDFEDDPQHVLTINVSDSSLSDNATVTVDVNDVNEAPVAVNNAFTIAENAGASSLGTVAATDVDGATLTWSITAGNGSSLFTIDAANGALSTTGDLDYETAAQHVLTITVTDNGTGTLSDTATVTVTVTDVAEASAPTN